VEDGDDWCTVTPQESKGNGKITIDAIENLPQPQAARKAFIVVTSGDLQRTITVRQAESDSLLEVNFSNEELPLSGGTYVVSVTSNLTWTAELTDVANNTWCTYTPTTYTGSNTFTVTVKPNTAQRRYTIMKITSGSYARKVTITQHGIPVDEEGALVYGVRWATRNVDEFGTFAATSADFGKYYRFNSLVAYSTDDPCTPAWSTDIPDVFSIWQPENDPCPEGWKLPTQKVFEALTESNSTWWATGSHGNPTPGRAYGPNTAIDMWENAGEYVFLPAAGRRNSDGIADRQFEIGLYYSNGESYWGTNKGIYLDDQMTGWWQPQGYPEAGVPLRCVKK
jgi:uncharacterized protein (TIGR02145 family)